MKFVNYTTLTDKEKFLIKKAIEASRHSISTVGHKVGSAILCKNGEVFVGATNARSRVIGSTCAERMAVDQLFFHGNKKPRLCVVIGYLKRKRWTQNNICTPCGVCLEMYWEMITSLKLSDFDFLCVSWNKKRILRARLSEFYPRVGSARR